MKYIKHFNESMWQWNTYIENEIKQSMKECFEDYITDYGMEIQFLEGFYVPGYNFMSDRLIKDLIKKYPTETDKFKGENEKCIKVNFFNEGLGSGARLNIYLNENSQSLFDESIHNLKSQLKMITNSFRLEGVPEKLSPDFYGINFLIIYE